MMAFFIGLGVGIVGTIAVLFLLAISDDYNYIAEDDYCYDETAKRRDEK